MYRQVLHTVTTLQWPRTQLTVKKKKKKKKGCYTALTQLRCNEPQASEGVQQGRQGAVHQPHPKKAEGNERAPAESQCPTRTTECKAANGTAARRSTGKAEVRSRTGLVASPGKKGQQRPLQCSTAINPVMGLHFSSKLEIYNCSIPHILHE